MTTDTHTGGAIEGTGGFVAAWLRPGDDMYSGGQVPAGLFGLRLHGTDTELLGTPAELGELGDRLAARWNSPRVDAVGQVADRLRAHVEQRGGFSRLAEVLDCGDVDDLALTLDLFGHHDEATNLVIAHTMSGTGGCDGEDHEPIRVLAEAADILAMAAGEHAEPDYTEADAAADEYVRQMTAG